jgi:hypothetical protein
MDVRQRVSASASRFGRRPQSSVPIERNVNRGSGIADVLLGDAVPLGVVDRVRFHANPSQTKGILRVDFQSQRSRET